VDRFAYALVVLLSLGVAGYAIYAYAVLVPGSTVHPDMRATYAEHGVAIRAHVFASAVALILGPFQFLPGLRATRPALHRWSGRVYLGAGVLVGGLSGLVMATHAFGGVMSKLGFGALALAWLGTGVFAYRAIRAGDTSAHRRWMIRNFALAFAAVTLRLQLPAAMALRIPFEVAYPIIAWSCWVPNLLAAEAWLRRRASPLRAAGA
jgi:uncharacterized membrane protein